MMNRSPGAVSSSGYPARLLYPDIGPEELAREEAQERSAPSWPANLQRTLTPAAHRPGPRQTLAPSGHQP